MLLDEKVEALRAKIDVEVGTNIDAAPLERMKYRLSDAIREGASVSNQAFDWSDEQGNLCALSAAVVAAKARGYIE